MVTASPYATLLFSDTTNVLVFPSYSTVRSTTLSCIWKLENGIGPSTFGISTLGADTFTTFPV